MKAEHRETREAKKLNIIYEVIFALILGGACFYVFISMLGLKYSPDSMMSGSFAGGLAGIWNTAADKLGSLDYMILPKYKADVGANGKIEYGFALTTVFLMFSAVSFLMIKARVRLLLLFYAVPLTMLMLILMLEPSVPAGILFAAAVIAVLALLNIHGKIGPAYFILPVVAVLIASGAIIALDKTVSLREPRALSDLGASVRASAENMLCGTDPLPAGDLASLSGKELKKARGSINEIKDSLGKAAESKASSGSEPGTGTALLVTMSEPESYYLRGFVGADYDRNKWKSLSNDEFYDMRDKVFWMNRRGFDGLSELSQASRLGGMDPDDVEIKVTVKDASRKTAYIPYELTLKQAAGSKARKSEMILPEGTKNYGGSHLGTEGLRGQSEYSYTAAKNITGEWTDAVGKFYTTRADEEINKFFISESHYNVIQYDKYLDIPEGLVELFKKEIGETGDISRNHADYKDTIEVISKYLKEKYIYSENFKSLAESGEKSGKKSGSASGRKDFVEEFVSAKRGCDVHYATLAALLFRYYGIPARYVEGYLITPDNLSGAAGGSVSVAVPRSANHAWTEIYIDGFGWIPFEATPEYSGIMKEADLTKGLQNVDYESTQRNRSSYEEEKPVEEENEEEDDLKALLLKLLKTILIVLASMMLLVLAVYALIRLAQFLMWRKAFADKDPKAGIRALYQYSNENKWQLSEKGEKLGLTASYSLRYMEEEEREAMRGEVKRAKEKAKEEKAKPEKASDEKEVDGNESGKDK